MFRRILLALPLNSAAFLALASSGCLGSAKDLVSEGRFRLETARSTQAELAFARVYQDHENLAVYGQIRRRPGVQGSVVATVRVTLHTPDGTISETIKRAFPRNVPFRRNRKSNFLVRFPRIPPDGSVVRIDCLPAAPDCS
jgi:hypothetical protein